MDLLLPLIPYIVAALSGIGGVIGGLWAGRKGYFSEAVSSQDRVIAAQKLQIDMCHEEVLGIKERIKMLEQEKVATRYVLKRQGVVITVEDGFITLFNAGTQKSSTIEIANIKINDTKDAS